MRSIVIVVISSVVFLFSSFITWYEGSALLSKPWEWEHTAIFTSLLKGTIESPDTILPIDHFFYAAKFSPFFPLLMLVSSFLLLQQAVSWLSKGNRRTLSIFYGFSLFGSLLIFFLLKQSPTYGLQSLSWFFLVLAILSVGLIVHLTLGTNQIICKE